MSRRPTEAEGRRAMERLAGRLSAQSERGGRKMTHDEAMRQARKVAERVGCIPGPGVD